MILEIKYISCHKVSIPENLQLQIIKKLNVCLGQNAFHINYWLQKEKLEHAHNNF